MIATQEQAEWFHELQSKRFDTKSTNWLRKGEPIDWLGMNITVGTNGSAQVDNEKYIMKMLEGAGLAQCNPKQTPISRRSFIEAVEANEELSDGDKTMYRTYVGKINWLSSTTHPSLALAHSILASFSAHPTKGALDLLKGVLRYSKSVMTKGLMSNPYNREGFRVYTDSNWAGDFAIDGSTVSRSGIIIYYNGMQIAWASTKQKAIALSSAQAELQSLSTGVQLGLHLWYIAHELGIEVGQKMHTFVDASAAISFAQNIGSKTRMKHIDIRESWVQQLRDNNKLQINKVDAEEQRADPLTKVLERVAFKRVEHWLNSELNSPMDLN